MVEKKPERTLALKVLKKVEAEPELKTYSVEGVTLRHYSIQRNVKLPSDEREIVLTS